MFRVRVCVFAAAILAAASAAVAATVSGVITDATGAAVPAARITLRDVASGAETSVDSDAQGRYVIEPRTAGIYLLVVRRDGFAEAARTVVVERADQRLDMPVRLALGVLQTELTVTAARTEREIRQVPLNVGTLSGAALAQSNPLSAGTALSNAANITPVGDGPFGVRPRLRGLDSTRLLVLVDGERLNTARLATDRAGAEVGLVATDALDRVEIVNGAGTLMYGSDALAGTINLLTKQPNFSAARRLTYGLRGFYSSNENGLRGSATIGAESVRAAFRIDAGAERFDNYRAGAFTDESTAPFFASGELKRADTIDTNFGFAFKAFPEPFNAPYVRTDREVGNSGAKAAFVNASALLNLAAQQTLRFRYQQRRATDVGFPDFAAPFFFNEIRLPNTELAKASLRYEARAITPWLANLSATAYLQRSERVLENRLPVQFPAPTAATFFPITVFRLDVLSTTTQQVWTPGIDLQTVITPASHHVITTGVTMYGDRSRDDRTTVTTTSMIGQVALGSRGPAATVFATPVVLGAPVTAHPVRVPDSRFRDIGVFAQDEWRVRPALSIVAGLRGDFYSVTSDGTSGYDIASVIAGATPAIDPATLPPAGGSTVTRRSLTGDVGIVYNADGRVSPFARYGRSYRHPNLEELYFAGPATAGSIVPNVNVKPETGDNVDAGVKIRAGRFTGGAFGFVNQYRNFIAQDVVVAKNAMGPLSQSTNYASVRIAGLELNASAPVTLRPGVITLAASAAFTRGTLLTAINPATGASLNDGPADNITPAKYVAAARFTHAGGQWWVEYGVRAQQDVTRVATTLLDSPFLIAQDLFSLDGFTVHRAGGGVNVGRGPRQARVVFAVENLTDRYYREQFQFAPARGRSFTIGLQLGAF
jgi:hemoglobin/transferrin/lactoferrin receptor protein